MSKFLKVLLAMMVIVSGVWAQTVGDFSDINLSTAEIVRVESGMLENVRREKNGLWVGAVLFALASGIFYATDLDIPTGIASAVTTIMVPSAIIRTATYQRARWEVGHTVLIRNVTLNKSNAPQQAITAPSRQKTREEITREREWIQQQQKGMTQRERERWYREFQQQRQSE